MDRHNYLLAQIKLLSFFLMACWQIMAVCLYKQDMESFWLGTYHQNGATQVKTVAL
jgi:hypothetical protein